MTILTDRSDIDESWVGIREMPFGMVATQTVATRLAENVLAAGGPRMLERVPKETGIGSEFVMHPVLADAVRRWCQDLPALVTSYTPTDFETSGGDRG